MGQIPAPKSFNAPQPFGASPNPNVLTQVQPQVQIPTAGVGFANTNQDDSQITQANTTQTPGSPVGSTGIRSTLAKLRTNGAGGGLNIGGLYGL